MTFPRKQQMWMLRVAGFAEGTAAAMVIFFVPYYVRSSLMEPKLTSVALILSLPAVTTLLSSNFWGATADATGRYKTVTGICLIGFFLCLVLLPAMKDTSAAITTVVICSLMYGACRSMLLTYATLIDENSKAKAISSVLLFESLGWAVGGLLFSEVYDSQQPLTGWLLFPGPGILCLLTAVMVFWKMKDPPVAASSDEAGNRPVLSRLLGSILDDFREVYRCVPLLRLSVVVLIATTSNFCFFGFFTMFYTEVVQGTDQQLGLTIACSTLTGVIFFTSAGRAVESKGGRKVLIVAVMAWVVIYGLFYLAKSPILTSLLFIVPIYPFFLVSSNALAAEASRSERRGGGLGALAGVSALSMALGTIVGGLVGDGLGLRALASTSAVITLAGLVCAFFLIGFRKKTAKSENSHE